MAENDEKAAEAAPKKDGRPVITRRALCVGLGGTAALVGLGAVRYAGSAPLVRPPGGQDEDALVSACIRCEKCYEVCPRGVIAPAHLEDGLLNMRTPVMDFSANWCDWCTEENGGEPLCVASCPTEALKTGLIGDPQLFALFETEDPEAHIEQIVYRSLKFKKKIVEQDEREGSVRACLNFGHTIGHGIEAVRGVRGRRTTGLYHGECVALGMLPMIEDPALVKRVRAVYRTLGLPTRAGANKEKVLAYMQHDKKASGSSITVIKCPGLGCWRADKLPMTELPALLGIEE